MSEPTKRFLWLLAGVAILLLWWRIVSDPLTAAVGLVGVGIAWIWASIRRQELTSSHVFLGAAGGVFIAGNVLRFLVMLETGAARGGFGGGFIWQGAFLGAGLVVLHEALRHTPSKFALQTEEDA